MTLFSNISQRDNDTKDELTIHWNNFIAGDDDAFSMLYEILVRDLFSFGTTFTTDRELVKDCIQDTFLRLYENRKKLSSVDKIKIYLLTAMKYTLIDAFRKQNVYHEFIDSYNVEDTTHESQEEKMITQEYEANLQNLAEKYKSALTKRQQKFIHYRFVEELNYEEISKLLNINSQSVANSIQRSFKKIRKIYLKK